VCLPLLAECMKVGADLMNALYVGGSVALDALVLMPQYMQQRLQLSIDGHEVSVTAIDFRSMKNDILSVPIALVHLAEVCYRAHP
jgi:hypothetical protein